MSSARRSRAALHALKALRVTGVVLLVLLAIAALAVGGTLTFAQTRWGGDVARRLALPRINAAIAGELSLDRFRFRGRGVTLERVELRDPEGAVVARVERIDVAFNPRALLSRRVELRSVQIDRPELTIVQHERGTNIGRALASAKPAQAAPTAEAVGPGVSIDLRALTVHDGVVDLRIGSEGPARRVRLSEIEVRAAARHETRTSATSASVDASFDGGRLSASFAATGAEARDMVTLHVDEARIPARVVRAFAPTFKSDVTARGDVRKSGDVASLQASLTAGGARIDARGDIDIVVMRTTGPGLVVRGSRIDLHRLIDGAPASNLAFALTVRGGGRDLASADGSIDFELPPSRLDGHTLGPIRFSARAERGRYTLADLVAMIPGVKVTGNAVVERRAVRARLRVEASDLAATARSLAPPKAPPPVDIAGKGRIDVAVDGSMREASLRIAGRVPNLRVGATKLDAVARDFTARARLGFGNETLRVQDLALRAGKLNIDADLVKRGSAVRGRIAISNFDLGQLPPTFALAGRVDAEARFDTASARPKLALDVGTQGLVVERQAIGNVKLSVRAEGDEPSRAELQAPAPFAARVAIETPLSLRDVMRRAPTEAVLMRTPFDVTGDVEAFPLALAGRMARYRLPVGGTVSSHVALSGTALDPKGAVAIDVRGATSGRFPPTDARVEVDFTRTSTEARVRVTRKGHPLLAFESRLGAGVFALRSPELFAVAPLRVRAVVGPLGLARLGLPPDSERAPPRVLKGGVHADLAIDGSLRAPRVLAHVHVADIRLDKTLIGYGVVEARYANRAAEVDARLTSANGGSLHAVAKATADLGYPAVIDKPIDVARLPLDVRLDANGFDVQGLSGVTQALRTVGGLVTASATVRGTVADPRISGQLDWKQGVVAVTGFGEYKNIHLAIRGDAQKLVLDELVANAGNGRARLTGDATHVPGRGYQFTAKADVDEFPVYQEGQALAQVTVEAALEGTASPLKSRVKVEIDEARVALSDAKRKPLQSLKVPADVVLVDDGKPLNRAQAERLRTLLAAREARARAEGDVAAARDARAAAPVVTPPASTLFVAVNAPRRLWVTGKDVYMELGLGPNFRVSMTNETRVFGQLIVHRGRIKVFGRRFDLKPDSTLQFNGPVDRPELDVRAQHRNEAENVTVLLTAKGPLDRLTIAVTSTNRPELNESQLYTLLITGKLQLGGGTQGSSSPSKQAASLLGGVVAAQLQKTLSNKLPLDVLTIDAGAGGMTGTQLEAGRYVTDDFYVGYVGRVGADPNRHQNRNAVHVEYQLSPRWGIEGEYGDVGTGSADLMWKRNY